MKKLTFLLIVAFISISSAQAATPANAPVAIDIAAALQSGQTEQEVLAQLTKSGMNITDAVAAMLKVAPGSATAITKAAIAIKPTQAAAITAVAIKAAPDQASAITKAALIAAPSQAVAINKASQSASDPTANLGATASGPIPGPTIIPTFSIPTSSPAGGGGAAGSPT